MPAQNGSAPAYGKVWGSTGGTNLHDVELPSGELAQVRRPGVTGLMAAGVLSDLDVLTSLVEQKHVGPQKMKGKQSKKATQQDEVAAILKDPGKLEAVRRVCLKVVAYMVVQPTVRLHFVEVEDPRDGKVIYNDIPEDERDMEPDPRYPDNPVIYTDVVDFEDAMYLFQYAVGGTRDLERFREQLGESVASVESLKDVPNPS